MKKILCASWRNWYTRLSVYPTRQELGKTGGQRELQPVGFID